MNSPLIPSLRVELQQLPPKRVPAIRPLYIPVEWMHYCTTCEAERIFVAWSDCDAGLIGRCSHCGSEVVARWTRTTVKASEAI